MTPETTYASLIKSYAVARIRVADAQNRQQFLNASADLWVAERALEQAALKMVKGNVRVLLAEAAEATA